jgi:hypothetical protein
MNKLSLYDREFLRSIHVLAESKRRHWSDEIFLRSCGVAPLRYHSSDGESRLAGIYQHPLDGTQRLLAEHNIPLTRENYLRLAFAGDPPQELDGEIEAMLPENLQNDLDDDDEED